MTGPPTPPPSSATEIQDAARTTLPPPVPVPDVPSASTEPIPTDVPVAQPEPEEVQPPISTHSTPSTAYELLFPSIAELARRGNTKELIQLAERGDLSAENDKDPSRLLIVVPMVLGYLITDEIPPARFALIRLPDNLKTTPLIQGLFQLVASVSERKYAHIYGRAEELSQFVQHQSFPNPTLAAIIEGMIAAFVGTFQKRTFTLLARAYTSIPLTLAQVYLGLTAEQVVNAAVPTGWEFHETTHLLTPPKRTSSASSRIVTNIPSTLAALNLVTDSVANLET